ncbi:DNA excision repair protein ERCC-4 [Sarotherodon galilaeus]
MGLGPPFPGGLWSAAMAAPYWVSVAVLVLMTVTNGETVIDPNQLAPIVQQILNRYTPHNNGANNNREPPMFSVAVSVPLNKQTSKFDMNKVPKDGKDDEAVKTKILNCDVYIGNKVVAATVLRWRYVFHQCPDKLVHWQIPKKCNGKEINTLADIDNFCDKEYIRNNLDSQAVHAESRTLDYFKDNDKIRKNSKDDLMVFYVRASPCDETCTNPGNTRNILSKIQAIKNWKNYVFVFSDVFRPDDNNPNRVNELRGSLERLGDAIADPGSEVKDKRSNGLQHIFRCYKQPEMDEMKCLICNTNGAVAQKCILGG